MSEAPSLGVRVADRRRRPIEPPAYAALDLGTNNCRLLIATPTPGGFRVVEAYSRIVRLGEGLSHTGQLSDEAMARSMAALKICAEKIRRRRAVRVRAIATQACRGAGNGADFVRRVGEETGLNLQIISPEEEARLSVAGCLSLLDRDCDAALVMDVGGGSTELSWVDLRRDEEREGPCGLDSPPRQFAASRLPIRAWLSAPVGMVTLAERYPEGDKADHGWFRSMVDDMKVRIAAFDKAEVMREVFQNGNVHLIGTSGAVTSLAGLHLNLPRYDRDVVDGMWLSRAECDGAIDRLLGMSAAERAAQPCIGADRADLILAGAAILQAVQETWPCDRVRVADRGLREGLLMSLMASPNRRRRRGGRRTRPRGPAQAKVAQGCVQ
jgi:exopolyphosphatase/guanosine-5'-triphosphate,3'-diphosphate pyrophosphatase